MSFLSALAPQAEMSFADIVNEVHRLRSENSTLKTQVGMLSDLGGGDAQSNNAVVGGDSKISERERDAVVACLAAELKFVEASTEGVWLAEAVRREELTLQCERALEMRAQAERTQQAVAAERAEERQRSAAAVAALEDQLTLMADEAARRSALAEEYGAGSELEEEQQRTLAAIARCEHKEAEITRLQAELRAMSVSHESGLRQAEATVKAAEAAAAAQRQKHEADQGVIKSLEGQLVRLSEGFNGQVEEVIGLQQQLEKSKASTVDKATARSWIVNYVESGNSARGEEMLRLMAEWWEFSETDLQRLGLRDDAPHPEREYRTGLSWSDAFAGFLEEETKPTSPFSRPNPRSPRVSQASLSELSREDSSLSEIARAEPLMR